MRVAPGCRRLQSAGSAAAITQNSPFESLFGMSAPGTQQARSRSHGPGHLRAADASSPGQRRSRSWHQGGSPNRAAALDCAWAAMAGWSELSAARRSTRSLIVSAAPNATSTDTLPLAFLAPGLVRAVIEARLPRGISTRSIAEPELEWSRQWTTLGISARPASLA